MGYKDVSICHTTIRYCFFNLKILTYFSMKRGFITYFLSLGGIFLFGLHSGCSKKSDNTPAPDNSFNGKEYVIAQGAHESNDPFVLKTKNILVFKAKFDSSAIYTSVDSLNQTDTNKLYGLSDCNSYHETNSARFGWRWVNGHLQIMAYCYINGVRPEPVVVDTVALNTVNSYSIAFQSDRYVFTVNDTSKVEVPKNCNYNGLRYQLYPYFGGDEAAPHEVRIWIQEL
ncbi:MAG: hypothetical protein JWO58_576 [Chitinophagaceae bacterium]|nr:hypothetical protein [Chitinophagaceae bacterium]